MTDVESRTEATAAARESRGSAGDPSTAQSTQPGGYAGGPAHPGAARSELPRLGLLGTLRFLWTQLTSMRTALVLLFGLALAAIPGSLVPQSKISPVRVADFIAQHPTVGAIYTKIGMFHVYTSPWFSAIYLLLFISLVGCIIPRALTYARTLRARPPATPRNLNRLPAYARVSVDDHGGSDPESILGRAAERLRQQRYRVDIRDGSVAAERGYLREAGNLIFHVSLVVVLLGVAIGSLFGFRGTSVVVVGQGFSNNLTQYDDFTAGASFRDSDLTPFSVTVKDFDVRFETGPVQRGAARLFRANVEVIDRPGAAPRRTTLEVNKPLHFGSTTVHLIGHGYAPLVTIKDAQGNVAFSGPVVFLPQDGNFTSAGAIKAPDARPERLGFEGFFLPTAVVDDQGPRSVFPDALNPALFVNAWYGPPKVETGVPENVYTLDTTGLTRFTDANGAPLRIALQPGDGVQLPNGKGSIQLDGWTRWVKIQVGDTPGVPVILAAIGCAVLGLCLSLFVRPRRVWVRVRPADGGPSVVEVGGLDRADSRTGLAEDVAELAAGLASREVGDSAATTGSRETSGT
jgi:cytochrome c biogenesis protein